MIAKLNINVKWALINIKESKHKKVIKKIQPLYRGRNDKNSFNLQGSTYHQTA